MFDLKERLKHGILFLDGATGTNLQAAGMPTGVSPELWILEHEDVLLNLQKAYVEAGTQVLYAPTFTANPIKLEEFGLGDRLVEINSRLVALTRQAAGDRCMVAGDLTMTGRSLLPAGDLDFEDLVECYKEQVQAIAAAGVDLFVIETMMSIQECRAAVLAVKECTDLPVFVTITLEENGKTLYGTDPLVALVTMEALGVEAFGLNCSFGPDTLTSLVKVLAQYSRIPLIVKPNAGIPKLIGGKTVFDMPPGEFAYHMKELVAAGTSVIGGCCGTTPEYIRAMVKTIPQKMRHHLLTMASHRGILTSERRMVELVWESPFLIIGERINPSGKKRMQEEFLAGKLNMVTELALEQEKNGAAILDINVGMRGIDEKQKMVEVVGHVCTQVSLPLCIDSSDPAVIEAALRRYPGRALVNSISCEKVKIEKLLPIVKKYGAMFILLPLTDEGLPKDQEERRKNIRFVLKHALALGFSKEDIVVDALIAAASAEPMAAQDALATIWECYHEGLATMAGLSNISFGLPGREYVNSTFLSMAIGRGLTMAIANPAQDLLIKTILSANLLMGRENGAIQYVEYMNDHKDQSIEEEELNNKVAEKQTDVLFMIREDVIKGKEKEIALHVREALKKGHPASELLNEILIPAINQVGEYFNQQKYYLPQLMLSARAMEIAVAIMEPYLEEDRGVAKGPVVILATVKGDVHDIGKNLVAMMLKNYGFQVIDLGKDVEAETIVAAAKKYKAAAIGLSALMTTTMSYMKEVVTAVKESGLNCKVVVGGAAVTAEFSEEIGADGYGEDAVGAVDVVRKLLQE